MAKLIASCNITGPNGELIIASDPENNTIPEGWPEEFIEDMKRGGAIVEVEDVDTVADIVPEASVVAEAPAAAEPTTDTEVPWFTEPPEATLKWTDKPKLGHIKFIDPNGKVAVFHVTEGATYDLQTTPPGKHRTPVWHVEVQGKVATVSPSVHFVGQWHTPNPVQFKLVDKLKGDK